MAASYLSFICWGIRSSFELHGYANILCELYQFLLVLWYFGAPVSFLNYFPILVMKFERFTLFLLLLTLMHPNLQRMFDLCDRNAIVLYLKGFVNVLYTVVWLTPTLTEICAWTYLSLLSMIIFYYCLPVNCILGAPFFFLYIIMAEIPFLTLSVFYTEFKYIK